jgi:transcriptional regulator with XRE-family HTH domain
MDLVRLGLGIRALRRRRGWRQRDLASAARVGQTTVSLIERGHSDKASLPAIQAVASAVDARLVLEIRWRAGDLDRLTDAGHARLTGAFARRLRDLGWEVRIEVTYTIRGRSGSVDILGWHAATCVLLVVEIKTSIASGEAALRKLDEKVRIASELARERFGWHPVAVGRLLAIEDTSTNRRRLANHDSFLDAALPTSGSAIRRWLASPVGAVDGRTFLSTSDHAAPIQTHGGRHRVRRPTAAAKRAPLIVHRNESGTEVDREPTFPTLLIGYERPRR